MGYGPSEDEPLDPFDEFDDPNTLDAIRSLLPYGNLPEDAGQGPGQGTESCDEFDESGTLGTMDRLNPSGALASSAAYYNAIDEFDAAETCDATNSVDPDRLTTSYEMLDPALANSASCASRS